MKERGIYAQVSADKITVSRLLIMVLWI